MERILILEDGESKIEEITDLDSLDLDSNFLANGVQEDPVALSVFLLTAKPRKKGYSYEKLIESVCDKEFVEKEDVERAFDKLLDCGLLTAKWIKENNKWERRFCNRGEVAKFFNEFSNAATEKQLKQMNGKEIAEHWLKLTKRLYLQDIH
jgi:hypothetical protein